MIFQFGSLIFLSQRHNHISLRTKNIFVYISHLKQKNATSNEMDDFIHLHRQSITQLFTFHTLNKIMLHEMRPTMSHSPLLTKECYIKRYRVHTFFLRYSVHPKKVTQNRHFPSTNSTLTISSLSHNIVEFLLMSCLHYNSSLSTISSLSTW